MSRLCDVWIMNLYFGQHNCRKETLFRTRRSLGDIIKMDI